MKTKGTLLLLLFSYLSLSAQNPDPVLMKINGEGIKKSEFEYIYNKNNTAEAIDQKDLDEYLELFKNFKLKVFEAKVQGLDTLLSFKKELLGYRRQLAQPYLEDKETEEIFMREAYSRMKENVSASHILIRLPQNYSVEDTLAAYNRIMSIRERVAPSNKKKKTEDFNAVAKEVSEDMSAGENGGHLGYISAFGTIYPFENVAYNTPIGSVSMPVRTSFGYHLIKVEDRRSDPGERLTAHVMLMTPREADEATKMKVKLRIDSIYGLIINGMDFSEAAKTFSEDSGSAMNDGQLPWFGVNRMIKEFENKAFSMNKGDISEPFSTAFGYHIMKLLDTKQLAPYDDKKNEIKSAIMRGDRINDMRKTTAEKLKKQFNYQLNKQNLNNLIKQSEAAFAVDSTFIAGLEKQNAVLFTIGDISYTQPQFADFLKNNNTTQKVTPSDILMEKFNLFVVESAFNYQDNTLESRHTDFASLMKEYHDGILLFEISNKEVWDRASKDTEGLKSFFEANKTEYAWDTPKYKGFVISCADKKIEKEAKKLIKKTAADSLVRVLNTAFNTSEQTGIKIEKVLVVKGDNKAVDCFGFKTLNKKEYEAPEKFPYVFVTGKILKNGPESHEDVRGLVVSDYQNHLEEQWLKYLRDKYTVEVDKDVLKTVQVKK